MKRIDRLWVFEFRGKTQRQWTNSNDHAPFRDERLAREYAEELTGGNLIYRTVPYVREEPSR